MIVFFAKITLSPCFYRVNEVFTFFDGESREVRDIENRAEIVTGYSNDEEVIR